MQLKVESTDKGLPVLIINKFSHTFVNQLRSALQKYNSEVYISPDLPKNIDRFRSIFIIADTSVLRRVLHHDPNEVIFISFTKPANWLVELVKKNTKVLKLIITADGILDEKQMENLLWFVYGSGKENILNIPTHHILRPEQPRTTQAVQLSIPWKYLIFLSLFFIILLHLAFVPFLIKASYQTYHLVGTLQSGDRQEIQKELESSKHYLQVAKKFYSFSRPTLLFFSQALVVDNLFELNNKADDIITEVLNLQENGQHIVRLLVKINKTAMEKQELQLRLSTLVFRIEKLENSLVAIQSKLPEWNDKTIKWKRDLIQIIDMLEKTKKLLAHHETIFAKDADKKYLILFANNMELRPGGGFIGSFGIVRVHDYTMEPIKVYDVYDADGQLSAHIEPPEPIRKYLNVDHWFLRDSAFSPDFPENYAQAKFFLDRELNERGFNGAVLITTTAVQQIMSAFGDIYLPDSNEKINAENFYMKTQFYAEKDFFPGSIQKRSFLSSLMRSLFLEIESASMKDLAKAIKKSLDEKQLVVFFDDQSVQDVFDSYYWAGRKIIPRCTTNTANCIVDYIFPVEANVGGNKANFFIDRSYKLDMQLGSDGTFRHKLSIQLKNNSPATVYPGGPYNNYFQVLLPKYAVVASITKNGVQVDDVKESVDEVKTIAMPLMIKPQEQIHLEITYQLQQMFEKGKGAYQLVVQKQIGTPNTDFALSLTLPDNIHITNQNFTPLVKDNDIVYNTQISTDKVFFIELLKE